ncbi:alpha/beta hydrolase [Paenibacillus antibioticophila]|uniref:alpha/beta hydrolase n=1 Tax=Paenibacillus antibioticophila TaxID=1274374 RepID=UPI0005C83F9C|nr:alpha/beta hydrolase [Paenibacillus antibioticophila]
MKIVDLNPNPGSKARLVGYLHDIEKESMGNRVERPCVVICPGGGFEILSPREADPPATAFFAKGYHVFTLYYSIREEASELRPIMDISLAIAKIRENAAAWGIIPRQIAVCGYSAGGYVAASSGTLWNHPKLLEADGSQDGQGRPDAMVLCYPVITAGEFAHRGSIERLGPGWNEAEREATFSLENHVTTLTPPAFLWHTVEDASVPVENSMTFAAALRRAGVPFECHLYQNGRHGMSMCTTEVNSRDDHLATWFPLCLEWLSRQFAFEY